LPRNDSRSTVKPYASRAAHTRRIIHILLLLFAGIIIVDALVGDQGLLVMRRARLRHAALEAATLKLRAENARLREEVRRLTEDPAAIEEVARRELGLIRPGEKVFIIKDLRP
jgi:cell division protein FtsB